MSLFTDLANRLRGVAPEITAVLEVADAAAAALGFEGADRVLQIVEAAFAAFAAHKAGSLTHENFLEQIAEYQQALATAHATEDAELDAMGPTPSPGNAGDP